MTETPQAPDAGLAADPPERTSSQVWALGVRVMLVQVVTLVLLWGMQVVFARG